MKLNKMRRDCFLAALVAQLALSAYAQKLAPVEAGSWPAHWVATTLSRSQSFEMDSKHTGQRYRIVLGLPHKAAPAAGYPVLWALDGLASFPLMEVARPRPASANESAQWRKKIGEESAGLVVAVGYASGDPIDVNARALDYTPITSASAKTGDTFSTQHGGAGAFLLFLIEELRPLLARHFVMDAQRHTLFGFSYGGLFALHTLTTQPQYFQRYWASSPSLWFGEHQTLRDLPRRLSALKFASHPVEVVITVGLDEQYPVSYASDEVKKKLDARTMVDSAQGFARLLTAADQTGLHARFQVVAGHDHQDMLFHGARRVIDFAFAP